MIQESLLSDLQLKILNYEFEEAFLLLSKNTSKQSGLSSTKGIKVIVLCCTACSANMETPEKINDKYLCKILNHAVQFINPLEEPNIEKYLKAIYHIAKFLFAKGSLESIATLEKVLVPEFLPKALNTTSTCLYHKVIHQFYSTFFSKAKLMDRNDNDSLLKLTRMIPLMCKRVTNQELLLKYAYSCSITLSKLGVKPKMLALFYLFVLELLAKPENNLQEFNEIINYFSTMFTSLLRSQDFDVAIQCHSKTLEILKPFCDREKLDNLPDVLEACAWFVPGYQVDEESISHFRGCLRNAYKLMKLNDNLMSACRAISNAVGAVAEYYKSCPSEWFKVPERLQMQYFKFLFDVSQILANSRFTCTCQNGVKISNLLEAIKLLNFVTDLVKLRVQSKVELSNNCKNKVLVYFDKNLEYLLKLKTCGCDVWQKSWHSIGYRLYNMSTNMHQNNDESAAIFLNTAVKSLLQFEGPTEIVGSIYLPCCLNVLAEIHLKTKDYKRALAYVSFVIAFVTRHPSYVEDALKLWIRIKFDCKEDDILGGTAVQEATLPEICEKFMDELLGKQPGWILDKEKRIKLLTTELDIYKRGWKSKICMMVAYKQLCQLVDAWTAARVFTEVWGLESNRFHEDVPKLIEATLKKCEKDFAKASVNDKVCLAQLYYLHYRACMLGVVATNSQDMLEAKKVEEARKTDPDIVSSYRALRLNQHLKTIKSLHQALDILTALAAELKPISNLRDINNLFDLLEGLANEFRLLVHSLHYLRVLELALKIAVMADENLLILKLTGSLLEVVSPNSKELKVLVDRADAIAEGLNLEDHLDYLVAYNLSKASAYLRINFDVAYKCFQKLYKIRERFEANHILKIKLLLLHHKLIMLPCTFKVEGHNDYSLIKITEAHNICIQHYSTITDSNVAYFMCLFFEVCEELIRMYHSLRMPREVRCYGKEVLVIAQKMVLPFRSLTLLFYLALSDMNSSLYADCRAKVSGFWEILHLPKEKPPLTDSLIQQSPARLEYAIKDLVDDFSGLILDVPKKVVYQQQLSPSSPKCRVEGFKVPSFIQHGDDCECFYCNSLECYSFALQIIYLEGLVNLQANNTGLAREFFHGGAKLFKLFQIREKAFSEKLRRKMSKDWLPTLESVNVETYGYLLLEFANISLRSDNISNAKVINAKLRNYLKPIKLNHLYLYNEALAQKILIIAFSTMAVPKSQPVPVVVVDDENGVKTPEAKMSKAPLILTPNRVTSSPPQRTVKGIRFDLSDNEDETATESENCPENVANVMKTPAPVMLVKEVRTRTARKTKPASVIVSNETSVESVIAMSPDAYGTVDSKTMAPKFEKTFASRTKLLTDRLKSSSKKCNKAPAILVTSANSGSDLSSRRNNPMAGVRKNLLSDLEEGPRRSKRNQNK